MKKMFNKMKKAAVIGSLAAGLIFSSGCEKADTIAPDLTDQVAASIEAPNFLTFADPDLSLNKIRKHKTFVSRADGGYLEINHGDPNGRSVNYLYGNSNVYPYNVYQIDPNYGIAHQQVGNLAFASDAIALHPLTGLLYYVANTPTNGVYKVGVWNPETNTNSTLPGGSSFKPAGKLAFAPDGTLYGVKHDDSRQMYTINTETGQWSHFRSYNWQLGSSGDLTFSNNGTFYNVYEGGSGYLDVIPLNSNTITNSVYIGLPDITGLCFGGNGKAYIGRANGNIGDVNTRRGYASLVGSTNINGLADLAPIIAHTELDFANVSLEVLPNSIDVDKDIEITMETTELSGGVAVTFQPHGTIFAPAAILNFEAHGVNLDGVDPSEVMIYYDNKETGLWEQMPCDQIIVDTFNGTVKVVNARLPHFSRYGIAAD